MPYRLINYSARSSSSCRLFQCSVLYPTILTPCFSLSLCAIRTLSSLQIEANTSCDFFSFCIPLGRYENLIWFCRFVLSCHFVPRRPELLAPLTKLARQHTHTQTHIHTRALFSRLFFTFYFTKSLRISCFSQDLKQLPLVSSCHYVKGCRTGQNSGGVGHHAVDSSIFTAFLIALATVCVLCVCLKLSLSIGYGYDG